MKKHANSFLKADCIIISQGVVFAFQPETSQSSLAFPGICVLPSGRWLASCRAAPKKIETRGQHVLLTYSDDEGQTWSTPCQTFTPPAINGKPGLFRSAYLLSNGDLLVVFYAGAGSDETDVCWARIRA